MKLKKTGQLNIRIDDDLRKTLETIEEENGLNPSVIIRGLLKEVASFFQENGFFALPVQITPRHAASRAETSASAPARTAAAKAKATATIKEG